jgi:hypothetical protein
MVPQAPGHRRKRKETDPVPSGVFGFTEIRQGAISKRSREQRCNQWIFPDASGT